MESPAISSFTYGILKPNEVNSHHLNTVSGIWCEGITCGFLIKHEWGSEQGFDALVPSSSGKVIRGCLFVSSGLESVWPALDALEGDEYVRSPIPVMDMEGYWHFASAYIVRTK